MKKSLLLTMLCAFGLTALAQTPTDVAVVEHIANYTGTASYVYCKDDGNSYVRNNLGQYERYGVYDKVINLSDATYYEGKLVCCSSDGKMYRHNGTAFVEVGICLNEISSTDYKNLNNWVTNDDHKAIFEGKWTQTANGYKINPYVGTGGHEPLMIQVPLEVGADYNYSFTSSWGAYDSWHGTEMHAYVCNFWDLGTQESGLNVSNSVLATKKFSFGGGTDVSFSLDFTADQANQTLLFQFGDVDDGNKGYWFEFDNLSVRKYDYSIAAYSSLETVIGAAIDANLKEVLRQTIALATAEGVDNTITSGAQTVYDDAGATRAEIETALDIVRAARKVNAQKQPDIYTGTAKADFVRNDEEYYFYNVGTGLWLTNGSYDDGRTAVDNAGLAIKLGDEGRGTDADYYLLSQFGRINFNMNVNTTSDDPWTFLNTETSNVYNIGVFDKTDDIIGYDAQAEPVAGWKYWSTVTKVINATAADNANPTNRWKLVSKTERNQKLETASKANPVDATYLLTNPTLDYNQDITANWSPSSDGGNATPVTNKNTAATGYEFWNFKTFNLSQGLTGLKPGMYRVSVNAFFRKGSSPVQAEAYNNGETSVSTAYLFADENEVPLPNITEGIGKLPGIATQETNDGAFPQWANEALEAFESGLYNVSVETVVGEDGRLTIGVHQTADAGQGYEASWVVIDNFRLTYLGPDVELTLNESDQRIIKYNGNAKSITLNRPLKANTWNTFCVPFNMTESQIAEKLGTGAEVKELTAATEVTEGNYSLTFSKAASIEAGKPYIVKVATAVDKIELSATSNSIPVNTKGETSATADIVTFQGVYTSGMAPMDSYIISGNKFYFVDSNVTLKGFRGYFTVAADSPVKALSFDFEDDPTGIESINADTDSEIYNLAGQRLSKAQRGVNIIDGKKVMVK